MNKKLNTLNIINYFCYSTCKYTLRIVSNITTKEQQNTIIELITEVI